MSSRLLAALAATGMVITGASIASAADITDKAPPPNFVLVLVDDMSENLYPYMTEVTRLEAEGVTFKNYFNATPWCCPSRATLQSGKYPHNTQVRANDYPVGGFERFMENDMDNSIGVQMQAAGYRTGLMGKYLNGYVAEGSTAEPSFPANFVPPGWDSWFSGIGYNEFSWSMVKDESGDSRPARTVANESIKPAKYYTDVLSNRAQTFIEREAAEPFFLLVAPFAPHVKYGPDPEGQLIDYPPAPRDRADSASRPSSWGEPEFKDGDCGPVACRAVPWPDTLYPDSYNRVLDEPLDWMPTAPLATNSLDVEGRRSHINRIQMLQSVNDMLRDIRVTLEETGQADNTFVMFTSDNGFHVGEHAMLKGKTTAYDHDIRTPLMVRPPAGLVDPVTVTAMVQNTDVLPTILQFAGRPVPADIDGVSMLPLMDQPDLPWRDNVLLELTNTGDEDVGGRRNPDTIAGEGKWLAPTYNALRGTDYLYVDYSELDSRRPNVGEAEYYDLTSDPDQTVNLFSTLSNHRIRELNAMVLAQTACSGASCASLQGL